MTSLEKIVHDIFFEKHGNPYTADKVAAIKGMSPAQVLEWSTTELDPANRTQFMTALGLDASIGAQSFLRRAFDAARRA
jgi:anaerobic selenocysteine-containing dehydrogenase